MFEAVLGFPETIAVPVGLQDVHPVGEAVQQGAGQTIGAQDLGPLLKGQVGGDNQAGALIGFQNLSLLDSFHQYPSADLRPLLHVSVHSLALPGSSSLSTNSCEVLSECRTFQSPHQPPRFSTAFYKFGLVQRLKLLMRGV